MANFFTKSKVKVQRTRKQYRLGALNTLTKQKNVLRPPIDKTCNHLVANPILYYSVYC